MSFELQLDALAQCVQSGARLVVLAGAGISMPAGIPGGRAVVQRLRNAYPASFDSSRDYEYVEAFNLTLPGEEHREERRIFFEELCAGIPPAEEHDWLAHLVDAGVVQSIITTNFDHLLDFAMMARCRRRPLIFMFEDEVDPALVAASPTLTKLHGDFLFDDLANLPEEMHRRLDRNMHEKLRRCLDGATLLVLGYSGSDESVMGFLRDLAGYPGVVKSVWWNIFSDADRSPTVEGVLAAARAAGKTAEAIGPSPALAVVRGLAARLAIAPPRPLPFGINAEIDNQRGAFGHRLVARRQRAPDRRRELTAGETGLVAGIAEAMTATAWTWVTETAPLDEVVAHLATPTSLLFDARRAFVPRDRALLEQFEIYADVHNVEGSRTLDATEIMTSIFRSGAVAIVMHPFRDAADLIGDMLARVLVALGRAGSGQLVVIDQSDASDWMEAIRNHASLIDPDAGIPLPKALRGDVGPSMSIDALPRSELVSLLAALRFAPAMDLVAAFSVDARELLLELEEIGVVHTDREVVVLAERIRRAWRGRATTEQHRILAAALERTAAIEAQHVRAHLLGEAEYHWFAAGEYETAFRLLLEFGVPDAAAARYFSMRLIAWAPILAGHVYVPVDPPDVLSMTRFCRGVIALATPPIPSAAEAAQDIVASLHEQLPPLWNDLLSAEDLPHEDRYPALRRVYVLARNIGDDAAYFHSMRDMSSWWIDDVVRGFERPQYRQAERALLFAREVVRRAMESGDHENARLYRDHEGIALGALGRADERRRVALEQVREVARDEGLSYKKGVVYGNFFFSEIEDGAWKSASGLLPESQLNFWYGTHLLGIIKNLQSLWRETLRRPNISELPRPGDIYTVVVNIVSVGSCDDPVIMELVEAMLQWRVEDACTLGDVSAAERAVADWIRVRNATPFWSSTDDALRHLYRWIGVAYFTFGERAVEPFLKSVAREGRHARSHLLYIDLLCDERTNVEWPALLHLRDSGRAGLMRAARRDSEAYVQQQ